MSAIFFKDKEAKKTATGTADIKVEKTPAKKETNKKSIAKPAGKISKKDVPDVYKILVGPHITEKAAIAEANGEYIFIVAKSANKIQITKAISDTYGVKVEAVRIINTKGKKRRRGQYIGVTSGFKKAVVKLVNGEKIELISR